MLWILKRKLLIIHLTIRVKSHLCESLAGGLNKVPATIWFSRRKACLAVSPAGGQACNLHFERLFVVMVLSVFKTQNNKPDPSLFGVLGV